MAKTASRLIFARYLPPKAKYLAAVFSTAGRTTQHRKLARNMFTADAMGQTICLETNTPA